MATKLLFKLRQVYLRFKSYYPKHWSEEVMYNNGKEIWKAFDDAPVDKKTLNDFQKLALSLDGKLLYSLQLYLETKIEELTNDFCEHETLREEQTRLALKNHYQSYFNAIS